MKGFTLVEMMVALLIFGLVAAAGVAVMSFSVDNRQIVQAHTDRLARFQRARALIRADLSQAAARRTRGPDGQAASWTFAGGAGAGSGVLLALVRRGWDNPDEAPRASLQYVEYRLSDDRLERRSRPALDGAELGPPQVLLTGVAAATVSFAAGGEWVEALPHGAHQPPPPAVRLQLRLRDLGEVEQLFLVTGEAW
ncbi:MAG: type II secretion system minor pseudopilin GspJ [Phenylobacterium sp.]|jgi:general secretion pathway protein J|uniref:type II secretion system minor pseudopilin GspJ n=1 Tax=Phenylobacterium sp. TaxID=1871053 RepID=UPI002A36032C|nr:type II secretion system minor pseudopilin GspJ [Phenylobacterium sp.]MDX9998103.1 type II secretion system minor pseudopilin GspJ [Phenylobacterium sp.]